jgi:hypothetical protein
MAAQQYAPLAGANASALPVASYLAGAPYAYADPSVPQVFGPVYLPRIHGLGLDTLEVASSGKVTVTLGDAVALDLERQLTPVPTIQLRGAQAGDAVCLGPCNAAASMTSSRTTIAGCNVLSVLQDRVQINGHLVVSGVYTTLQTTRLLVDDTIIVLARTSNGQEPALDGVIGACGIVLDTVPASGATPNSAKSLLWNNGAGGTADLLQGDATAATESYWELRGGQLRITAVDATGHDTWFALRLGGAGGGRLEVVQSYYSPTTGARVTRRVGSFGVTML